MPAIRLIALGAVAAMPAWSAAADDDRQVAPPPAGAAIYKTCLDSCLDHEAGDWHWCNQQCSVHGQDPVDLPQEAPEPLEAAAAACPAWNTDAFMTIANRADIERCIVVGADPNSRNDNGDTPLHLAVRHGRAEALAALLNAGADPNSWGGNVETLLRLAARHGHAEALAALLKAGADPHAQDSRGRTPLYWAESGGRADVVTLLQAHGAGR